MAVFAVQLRQAQGGGGYPNSFKYSNVFYVNEPTAADAAADGQIIWMAMREAMFESAYCASVYATDLVPGTANYYHLPIPVGDQRGVLAPVGGSLTVHPIVCGRVDLIVPSSRPSRKFVRGGYATDVFANGMRAFVGTYLLALQDAFEAIITNTGGQLCDVDGQPVVAAIAMGVTTHELGAEAFNDVPTPPSFG